VHALGFYMHFAPDEVMFGGGLWMPPADTLGKVRDAIAGKSAMWKKAVTDKRFAAQFDGVRGEALTRPPRGYDAEHPFIEDIKRKSFFAMHEGNVKLASSPKLVDEVTETFAAASPLLKFLCNAVDAPF
jgi:uncharacterized protein (TIGR02453 family)